MGTTIFNRSNYYFQTKEFPHKKKCRECKYHKRLSSNGWIYCGYLEDTGTSCIDKKGNDKRGENFHKNRCKLFDKNI